MPKYIAKAYLTHQGKVVTPGTEIDLSEEQGRRLVEKEKVELTEKEQKAEKTFTELKEEAKEKGIEGYSAMNKAELIAALAAVAEEIE